MKRGALGKLAVALFALTSLVAAVAAMGYVSPALAAEPLGNSTPADGAIVAAPGVVSSAVDLPTYHLNNERTGDHPSFPAFGG